MSRHAKIGRHYNGKWGLACRNLQFLYDFPKLNDTIIVNGGELLRREQDGARNSNVLVRIPAGDVFQLSDQAAAEKKSCFLLLFLALLDT